MNSVRNSAQHLSTSSKVLGCMMSRNHTRPTHRTSKPPLNTHNPPPPPPKLLPSPPSSTTTQTAPPTTTQIHTLPSSRPKLGRIGLHDALCSAQCAVCSVQCTVCSVCAVYSVQRTAQASTVCLARARPILLAQRIYNPGPGHQALTKSA